MLPMNDLSCLRDLGGYKLSIESVFVLFGEICDPANSLPFERTRTEKTLKQ